MAIVSSGISRKLTFKVLLKRNDGPEQERNAIIANDSEWKEFFDNKPPASTVDISQGFIAAIGLGQRPTAGFAVEVKSVYQLTSGFMSGTVHINYQEVKSSGHAAQMLTAPFAIIRIDDLQFATNVFFHKLVTNYVVIALTGTDTGCKVVPEDAIIPMIYSRAFGPASQEDCEAWVSKNCDK